MLTEREAKAKARAHMLGIARLASLREALADVPREVWWYLPADDAACALFVRDLVAGYFAANGQPAPDWATATSDGERASA